MSNQLLIAIIAMTTALISYSIGVWGEKLTGTIRPIHLGAFWFGLLCDTTGTEMMRQIAANHGLGGFNLHSVLGAAALILMAVHAFWATRTYLSRNPQSMQSFHRFSLSVWGLWLIPFISGLVLANLHRN